MVRTSLDSTSKHINAVVHGDGLTSLQFRTVAGENTHEVQSNMVAPTRVRLEKRGDFFYAFVAGKDGELEPAGAAVEVKFDGPFYVGIGVSAHDKDAMETAKFSNVKMEAPAPQQGKTELWSAIETVPIASGDRRVAYVGEGRLRSPRWSQDGTSVEFEQNADAYRVPLSGGKPMRIVKDAGAAPAGAGQTSPDGWIYFSAKQSGRTQILRKHADGTGLERVVTSETNDSLPLASPDGKWLLYQSSATTGQEPGQDVTLNLRALADGKTKPLAHILSGDGTKNEPSWSPDSAKVAFVSYEYLANGPRD